MKRISQTLLLLLTIIVLSCNSQKSAVEKNKVVYKSDNLIIVQLSDNVYQHISYLDSETFGKVDCNGMIVKDGNEAVVFDTTIDDKSSAELISWIKNDLHSKINAVVATHFHEDCVGGLKEFNKNNIPSYSNNKTIELTKKSGFNVPDNGFDGELELNVGSQKVYAKFFGEGHTRDNVIGYFPKENAMFGGCLVKEVNASKGNLADANVQSWSSTIEKLKKQYPDTRIIIPGHGKTGGTELLDYTIKLFKN
ncbi:subclass B1 metallo-beta-lactamase [Chryseobacterium oryctis]|uniref:beta-lactamase n=1 Tax=Chryseobacterium oryctis TaxID=2952618 RepID=A0ABT3HJC8_9FLAO|nr:subclass B1 metallo-beta-lactamase [Chryseobacterium oryctis]MCW3159884.1 subclass B1 metallo-beta-lactamase [Chryseobacterium oryctis]